MLHMQLTISALGRGSFSCPECKGTAFLRGFLFWFTFPPLLLLLQIKHIFLVTIFCYSCPILINFSNQTYLATTPVFSAFFILTFSLPGTFFSVADAVRSCMMGPIALNTIKCTSAVLKLSAVPQNVPFVSAYTHCETEEEHHCRNAAKYQRRSLYIFKIAKNWSNPLNSVRTNHF